MAGQAAPLSQESPSPSLIYTYIHLYIQRIRHIHFIKCLWVFFKTLYLCYFNTLRVNHFPEAEWCTILTPVLHVFYLQPFVRVINIIHEFKNTLLIKFFKMTILEMKAQRQSRTLRRNLQRVTARGRRWTEYHT